MRINSWLRVALFNFMIAALMGILLRAAMVFNISWLNYGNWLHGHSHIAMLGWIFMALYALLIAAFVPKIKQHSAYYRWLFVLTEISVIGMLISFPIQGYAAVSITFSTINLILSYFFAIRLWKDSRGNKSSARGLMRSSLLGMFISTFGLWGMAMVMSMKLGKSELYNVVIQFYLHFQFNIWFILAVIALLLHYFDKKHEIRLHPKVYSIFIALYYLSICLTFFHVLYWAYRLEYMYWINSVGVIIQFVAVGYLLFQLSKQIKWWKRNSLIGVSSMRILLLNVGILSWVLKVLIQLSLIVPEMAIISTQIRNFMVGYIHLINLGIVCSLLFFLLPTFVSYFRMGREILLFLLGILISETILFWQGILLWQGWEPLSDYNWLMFVFSIPLPLSIIWLWARNTFFLPKPKSETIS